MDVRTRRTGATRSSVNRVTSASWENVLDDPVSLQALRDGKSLDSAYRSTRRGREDFMRHLNQAIDELKLANANVHHVERDDKGAKDLVNEALKIIQVASEWLA